MKVLIQDNIYIVSDERQYVLKEFTGQFDKKGNEVVKILGYFGKVSQALKHVVKMNIMKSDATTLRELVADIEQIDNRIEELLLDQ
jgi:hypothetical protein